MQSIEERKLYGLPLQTVEKIQTVFKAHPQVEQVVIYGSRAKGCAEAGSDIDLTMMGEKLSNQELLHIEMELDELMLPYTIDLSCFHSIKNVDLLEHIRRKGKTFYQLSDSSLIASSM